ncbi:WxL domain-containing protein [Enterococcus faecium]|uniref:WxL domain-containing protein n=1 Tax=Enterococcus faecium TaxID=1352 RepID=UPI0025B188E5|nr:WxL domain-containing protein [Enterococcus faecium]EME8213741.1 WxL domain-containing protein [Enterococcus faecium]MDN3079848.1 WxL domain-containing protein [Enterococcus faecium]MDQ8230705.1 WxL domain-containing protein [Enterococcus faecium]MDQ8233363.1 WxL domain-containing protein [Enterococcus faecium]MDQ8240707.1 WxL domain-containing protein [Enterococcus faecium]
MKQVKYILLGTTILGVCLGSYENVLADNVTSGTTNAVISVKPGDLTVTPEKTIDFGSITLNGKNQTVSENKATVNVSDYRGTSAGWSLTLKEDHEIKGLEMLVAPSIDSKTTAGTVSEKFSVNTQDQKFAEVTKDSAKSHPTDALETQIKLNSTLNLAKDLASNSYSMNLIWTLTAGPK